VIIEECGTGGTSRGKFTRRRDAAWDDWDEDGRTVALHSCATGNVLAEIDTWDMTVRDFYDATCLGAGADWHEAVKIALGPHTYGHTWYQVKGESRRHVPQYARPL
jgi:hypothetical protein